MKLPKKSMPNKFASAEKSKRGIADKLSPPTNKKQMFSSLSPIKGGNGFAAEQTATEGDTN
jgi:hypothetical protein